MICNARVANMKTMVRCRWRNTCTPSTSTSKYFELEVEHVHVIVHRHFPHADHGLHVGSFPSTAFNLGLDVMICNAGVADIRTMVSVREMPMDDYMHTFNLNFFCPVVMTKEALPHLEKTRGSIVQVSSITGEEIH